MAFRRPARSFIATLPTAQAECDYVQAVVAQLHARLQQADRLTRAGSTARAPHRKRKPGGLRSLQGKLDRVEAAIDHTEEELMAALETMRAKHGTTPACLQQIVFTP